MTMTTIRMLAGNVGLTGLFGDERSHGDEDNGDDSHKSVLHTTTISNMDRRMLIGNIGIITTNSGTDSSSASASASENNNGDGDDEGVSVLATIFPHPIHILFVFLMALMIAYVCYMKYKDRRRRALENALANSPVEQARRQRELEQREQELLQKETKQLKDREQSWVQAIQQRGLSKVLVTGDFQQQRQDQGKSEDDVETGATLSNENGNGIATTVNNNPCAICLDAYSVGDRVVWSNNKGKCPHVFHQACLLDYYLATVKRRQRQDRRGDSNSGNRNDNHENESNSNPQETTICPCCRQDFLVDATHSNDETNGNDVVRHSPATGSAS